MELTQAVRLIEHWEGCVLHAYQDSVGVWTIGYGTTKNVKPGQTCTKAQAVQWMMMDAQTCASSIQEMLKVQVTNSELSALVSLAYNIGLHALVNSTLMQKLNEGAPKLEVADQFMEWIHAGGHVLAGLVARRKAERLVFLS